MMAQRKMIRLSIVVGSFLAMAAFGDAANAAELYGVPNQAGAHRLHARTVCGWKCRGRCPDWYSCYSMYGAYGPYGGAAFWSARYTFGDWGYYR